MSSSARLFKSGYGIYLEKYFIMICFERVKYCKIYKTLYIAIFLFINLYIARFIILPQAIAIVLPALGNEFIAMLKDTSLVSILSVRDITQRMREFQAQSFLPFEPFNSAALLYIILTLIAASLIKKLERVVNRGRAQK